MVRRRYSVSKRTLLLNRVFYCDEIVTCCFQFRHNFSHSGHVWEMSKKLLKLLLIKVFSVGNGKPKGGFEPPTY